ncbi:MAG: hypothetical protein JNK76_00015 [Planctomycetales bacterium]|nr:hypothetical protein [Planctomycetales bacterium]MBN8625294.1 hypothetical protein [Planctomycetota bacterium]
MIKLRHVLLALVAFHSPLPTPHSPLLLACPFCNAVQPSFAELRAEAQAVVVGEALGCGNFTVRQVLDGAEALGMPEALVVDDDRTAQGRLALLLGKRASATAGDNWRWTVIAADETSLAYYVRTPVVSLPAAERLPYFVKYLEHADRDVAEDAFREFGRAPFYAVAAVAPAFPYESLRAWLVEPNVPGERKGFYGMALGLTPAGPDRAPNVELLRKVVTAPAGEFRAGFDGVLGGFLWAEAAPALDLIDERFLRNPAAAEGDVRHTQAALRFYLQYGRGIPETRLIASVALLLDRPATAPGALQDLTRRRAWAYVARAEKLFLASTGDDPALDRAAVGYLLVCPEAEARAALKRLKQAAPERTAEAIRSAELLGIRAE